MNKHRVGGVVIGLLTFAATHLIVVAKWSGWFHGEHEPWFLNASSAGQFTAAFVFVVSLLAGLLDISGLFICIGAIVSMAVVMALPPGPGTLWPIVLAIGGFFLAVAILTGNVLGLGIRWLMTKTATSRLRK